jgi:hypothetical protein
MLVTGTAAVPLFQSVTIAVEAEVAPTPVVGNARLPHVITKGEGVIVDGVVVEVLLLHAAASTTKRSAPAASVDRVTNTASSMVTRAASAHV